jgi:hypothetical protein
MYQHQYYMLVAGTAQPPRVNTLRTGRPRNRGSIPDNDKFLFLLQTVQAGSGAHPGFYPMGAGDSLLGVKLPRLETAHPTQSNA